MKRFVEIGILALLIINLIIGTWQFVLHTAQKKPSSLEEGSRLAVVLQQEKTSPFWREIWNSIFEASEEYSIVISPYTFTSSNEIEALFETALLSNTDGIIFCAPQTLSLKFKQMLIQAKNDGIPLVCIDTDVGAEYRDVFIGTDNIQGGKILANEVISWYKSNQRILVINSYNTQSRAIAMRQDGFNSQIDTLENYGTIESLNFSYRDTTGKSIQDLQKILTSNHKPDYIVAFGPGSTETIAAVLKSLGMQGIFLLGVGENKEVLQYVEDGTINLLLAQDCSAIGILSIESAWSLINRQPVESELYYDMVKITPDNLEENEFAQRIMEAE